jgi:hypothetical protein
LPERDNAENQQEEERNRNTGLDCRAAGFGAVAKGSANVHCKRTFVDAVRVAGIPGHGTRGVKVWLALIVRKTRFGPNRPAAAHDSVHAIAVMSSHSQLWGKLGGKVSAGVKLVEVCIELWMPAVSVGLCRAYSAPMRVVAVRAVELLVSIPKSAIPAAIRMIAGATKANSAATLPRQARSQRIDKRYHRR